MPSTQENYYSMMSMLPKHCKHAYVTKLSPQIHHVLKKISPTLLQRKYNLISQKKKKKANKKSKCSNDPYSP